MDKQISELLEKWKYEMQIQTKTITENLTITLSQITEEKLKPIIEKNKELNKEI